MKRKAVETISRVLLLPLYLFHFQRQHVERNCLESKCISLLLYLSLYLAFVYLSHFTPPAIVYSSVYLGLPRELPVFRSVTSRQYIFQILMATAHARSHPYCKKHSSSFSFSLPMIFSLGLSYSHASNAPFARGAFSIRITDIAIEERTFLRLPCVDITSIKYSQAPCGCGHTTDLSHEMTTSNCEVSSRKRRKIIFNYLSYSCSVINTLFRVF